MTFSIAGDFDAFYLCHCARCKKGTGSAHAANLFSSSATLHWISGRDQVVDYTLPDTRHGKSFCGHCGSAVPTQKTAGFLVTPVGCLDTEITMRPTAHIFTESKTEWQNALTETPEFPGLPE